MREALRDQPLPPADLRFPYLTAKAGVAQGLRSVGNERLVNPGGAVKADLSLQRIRSVMRLIMTRVACRPFNLRRVPREIPGVTKQRVRWC